MRFTEWLRKQPDHIHHAVFALVMGAFVTVSLLAGYFLGVVPSWGPSAIALIATLVVSGGLYRMPDYGDWGD